jgi:biopolymer transport protein ExbB
MDRFLPHLQETLLKHGVDGAVKLCKAQPASEVVPRYLLLSGLEASKQGLAASKKAMITTMELEILPKLNYLLAMMMAIAKIATMVGLLGTVLSMIGTFQVLGSAGKDEGAQAAASKEIGLALFATALGLVSAIPLVFAHVLFKAWIHEFEIKMKSYAQKLILLIQNAKSQPKRELGQVKRRSPDEDEDEDDEEEVEEVEDEDDEEERPRYSRKR